MPLRVDAEKCIGCGLCPAICPRAFVMSERGDKAEVIDGNAAGDDVGEAIASCPTEAISNE